jgi:hypothetical protein
MGLSSSRRNAESEGGGMTRKEIEKFIENLEANTSYTFYREVFLVVEKVKQLIAQGKI